MLPVVLMIVFGVIDFGRLLNAQIVVSQAAREGARAESVGGSAAARANAAASSIGGVGTAVTEFCPDDPDQNDDAEVRVTHVFHFVTPVMALAGLLADDITLDATGVMPCRG